MSIPNITAASTVEPVSAQPAGSGDHYHLIRLHLGGETVVVPVDEYQRPWALERRASAEDPDAAEADARSYDLLAELLGLTGEGGG